MGDGAITPTLKLAWPHNFDDNIWTVNAAFDGLVGSNFEVTGRGLSQDSWVVGAGLDGRWCDNTDTEARMASYLRRQYLDRERGVRRSDWQKLRSHRSRLVAG